MYYVFIILHLLQSILHVYSYDDIINFHCGENEFVMRAGSGSKTALRFQTRQGLAISDLVQAYLQARSRQQAKSESAVGVGIRSLAAQVNMFV